MRPYRFEKCRKKQTTMVRNIVEQYFGLSHLHDNAQRARFTTIAKIKFDCLMLQAAYNIQRGLKIKKAYAFYGQWWVRWLNFRGMHLISALLLRIFLL